MQFAGMFFDLDDTLVDDDIATKAGVDELFLHYKGELSDSRHAKWDEALDLYYPAFARAEVTVQVLQIQRIRHVLDKPELPEAEALEAFEYFMQHYVNSTELFPEALEVLTTLKANGARLGVISNGPDQMQHRKISAIGLSNMFDVIMTAERAGLSKPNEGIFKLALTELGLSAEECCCVGDNLKNDAVGAQEAGLTGIFIDRENSGASYNGLTIHSLKELLI